MNIIREYPVLKNSKNIAQKAESKQKQIRRTENELILKFVKIPLRNILLMTLRNEIR